MYNQIPPQFMADGQFARYLRQNNVSVVHLVREAQILKMASAYNNVQQMKHLGMMHTVNASIADKFRDTPPLPWDDTTIDKMLALEYIAAQWQAEIHFMPVVQTHYLSYETLLPEMERSIRLDQVIAFLHPSRDDVVTTPVNILQQLHEPLCSQRIANYSLFRAHEKVKKSRSARACDLLEFYEAENQHDI